MSSLQSLVVGTDFSDTSEAAIESALTLASTLGAQVTLVHAYELPLHAFPDGAVSHAEVLADLSAALRKALDSEIALRAEHGVAIRPVLVLGPAVDALNDVADEVDADLIVVGTNGRSGFARTILGSTAEQLVRSARRPVLAVRATTELTLRERLGRKNSPHGARAL
jgi:nucleotide-binding universal stress UspA family protein